MLQRTLLVLVATLMAVTTVAAQTVEWQDGFEGSWTDRWFADGGTWEAGTPSAGPGECYDGDNCAGTWLAGGYDARLDTRFVRIDGFVVPAAADNPRLRFWHWYNFGGGDAGEVQISTDGGTSWETISPTYTLSSSSTWTRPMIDLSSYAGATVRLAFHMQSDGSGGNTTVAGWYVDEVSVVTGPMALDNPEGFEAGLGDWSADRGTWEVGTPSAGPGECYDGDNCAGTWLDGGYDARIDTRLVSAPHVVPSAAENPRLRFWHWYNFGGGDAGEVQISTDGGASWETISPSYTLSSSSTWTRPLIDLSSYAGATVRLAFHMLSDGSGGNTTVAGWYVDEVSVVTGPMEFDNPEGFEDGLGDWSADRGTWEVGTPSAGPGECYDGDSCAGTWLDGGYDARIDTRLVSAPYVVPSAAENPRLRFWHWYNFGGGDAGEVQISTDGGASWETISPAYTLSSSSTWTRPLIDLSSYAGATVRLAFHMQSDGSGGNTTVAGWYVDEVSVVTGPMVFDNPEGFEAGLGDWSAERGTWEVGTPSAGPGSCYDGDNCAGTWLDGGYDARIDTRLVSAPHVVPSAAENPRLRFWHWYNFGGGDAGEVQISTDGGASWETISPSYTLSSSNTWTRPLIDLSSYGGATVRLAFHMQSDGSGGNTTVAGWYVDEVTVEPFNRAPVADPDDLTTNEDLVAHFDVLVNDSDADDDPLTLTVTRAPAHGVAEVDDGGTPDVPEDDAVTYTPAADYNGPDDFIYQVDDGQATDTAIVQINVRPVNDAPSFTGGADHEVEEDAGEQTVEGWATSMSAGPANESDQTLTFVVNSDEEVLFSQQPAVSEDGTLTYTPAPNAYGTANVTARLRDSGGTAQGGIDTSGPQSFVITINPVNDAPAFAALPDVSFHEDGEATLDLDDYASDVDHATSELTFGAEVQSADPINSVQTTTVGSKTVYSVTTDETDLQITLDTQTHVATFTSTSDSTGVFTVAFTAEDPEGLSATGLLEVTVNPVNDAPSFVAGPDQQVDEDAGVQTVEGWATAISAGPANEAAQSLAFEVVANSNPALFAAGPAVSSDGTLSYTTATHAFGAATVSIVLKDGGGTNDGGTDTSTPQSFTITVNPVNDPPPAATVISPAHGAALTIEGDPDTPFEVSWSAVEDADGDDVTYSWQLSSTSDFVEYSMDEDVGSDTLFGTDYRALDSLLVESDVSTGGSLLLYHRVITSDGVFEISGAASTFTVTRGVLTGTGDVGELPDRFVLHGAYPNPFNPSTTLRFDLPNAAEVRLHVYDTLGRLVRKRSLGRLAAGFGHEVRVDADALRSGMYLYRLTAEMPGGMDTRNGRFVLVK